MNISPPRPVISGSVRPCTAHAATAASMALPPDFKTRMPASDANACPDAIMPLSERTTGRHVDVCASGETVRSETRLTVSRAYRRMVHLSRRMLLHQGAQVHRVRRGAQRAKVHRVRGCTGCEDAQRASHLPKFGVLSRYLIKPLIAFSAFRAAWAPSSNSAGVM